MDTTAQVPRPCPQCGARVRVHDVWCSLCYAPTGPAEAPPAPRPVVDHQPAQQLCQSPEPVASPEPDPSDLADPAGPPTATVPRHGEPAGIGDLPLQRRGPLLPARALVGGEVPDDVLGVLDDLAARLAAEEADARPKRRPGRPAVLAAGGAAVVLAVVLVTMALVGALL